MVGMLAGHLAVREEASGGGGEPEGMSGDTRPLGVVDMMGAVAIGGCQAREKVPKFF